MINFVFYSLPSGRFFEFFLARLGAHNSPGSLALASWALKAFIAKVLPWSWALVFGAPEAPPGRFALVLLL